MRFAAVIVAAGSGSRAGAGLAKQWRPLGGRAVARWSAEALALAGADPLIVVIPGGEGEQAKAALAGIANLHIVSGGASRTDSVRNGLAVVPEAVEAVLVHDAARPFLTQAHITALLQAVEAADGAVPVLPVADTLKRQDDCLTTVPRDGLWRAQTPQAFRRAVLVAAYAAAAAGSATDDAALVEAAGARVVGVPGDPMLFKLTYPEDFTMADALAGAARLTRTGQGFDAHRWGAGEAVWLCGVKIDHDQTLIGHSDADAGLHALTDALLGAIGEGDIGDHFPPSDPQWRGAPSDLFLRKAVELVAARGGRICNIDVTLICERPKIKPHRQAMRERLAEILDIPLDRVSVKATTTEGMGFTGRGEGLAAQAVATVETPL